MSTMEIQKQLQPQQEEDKEHGLHKNNTPPLPSSLNDNKNNNSNNNDNNNDNNNNNNVIVTNWIRATEGVRELMKTICVKLAVSAATYPKTYVGSLTIISLTLLVIGFLTNFEILADLNTLFAPMNSRPTVHFEWILDQDRSGFHSNHPLFLNIHTNGNNILDTTVKKDPNRKPTITDNGGVTLYDYGTPVPSIVQVLRTAFDSLEVVRNSPGYSELCTLGNHIDPVSKQKSCRILAATRIWDHDRDRFEKELRFRRALHRDDYDWLLTKLSADTNPDGTPMFHEAIIGRAAWETDNNNDDKRKMVSAKSLLLVIELPVEPGYNKQLVRFEHDVIGELKMNRQKWVDQAAASSSSEQVAPTMEFFADEAYTLEFLNAVNDDLWLLVLVFGIMLTFTCSIFYDAKDKVNSRCLVGIASITTITMSMACAFGVLFIIGVPYTFLTQMMPFVVVGIGLDDTFIITGEFYRQTNKFISNKNRSKNTNNHEKRYKNDKVGSDDEIVQRVRVTMEEVGVSISLTTITTTVAFLLGVGTSTLKSVVWLCMYGVTMIVIDFFFQVTYFVALLVLNEQRVRDNKRDIFFCIEVKQDDDNNSEKETTNKAIQNVETTKFSNVAQTDEIVPLEENYHPKKSHCNQNDCDDVENGNQEYHISSSAAKENQSDEQGQEEEHRHLVEKCMSWYADKLLKPRTKKIVLAMFAAIMACCLYSITLFEQRFDVTELLPAGSHIQSFLDSAKAYSTTTRTMAVYFRNMNQSDPMVQEQMINYIEDITTDLNPVGGQSPAFCWFRDIQLLMNGDLSTDERFANSQTILPDIPNVDFLGSMSTNQQINFVLSNNIMKELYGPDITFEKNDATGEDEIKSSRCWFMIRDLDLTSVDDQVNFLLDQRRITESQPININIEDDGSITQKSEWPMFTFEPLYMPWEAFIIVVRELIFTIIMGVVAVCIVTLVMIPHRSAILIVFPMICIMYINFLGVIRYLGLDINGTTYIVVVISIGVLVDFLLHILMKFYELQQHNPQMSRDDCVKNALETMGASMVEGGLTTFLAITPFLLSVLIVFRIIFNAFFAMVTVGIIHGIVLLPVVLSVWGPEAAGGTIVDTLPSLPDVPCSSPPRDNTTINDSSTQSKTITETVPAPTRKMIY